MSRLARVYPDRPDLWTPQPLPRNIGMVDWEYWEKRRAAAEKLCTCGHIALNHDRPITTTKKQKDGTVTHSTWFGACEKCGCKGLTPRNIG